MSDSKEKKVENYISSAAASGVLVLLVMWLWPSVIPYGFWELWTVKGSVGDWFVASWPIFVWAIGVTFLVGLVTTRKLAPGDNVLRRWDRPTPGEVVKGGFLISLRAGITEEIAFRWLIFLGAIIGVKVVNFLLFGCLGFGVPEWFYLSVFGPIADFFTMGHMHGQLFHPGTWAVGAAILSANATFRDGHKYLGFVGWVNSWVIGMFFFWLTFTFGLPAAILIHFSYDMAIFLVEALHVARTR